MCTTQVDHVVVFVQQYDVPLEAAAFAELAEFERGEFAIFDLVGPDDCSVARFDPKPVDDESEEVSSSYGEIFASLTSKGPSKLSLRVAE
ncbi:hypothetical protein ACLI4Z_10205 [Natrialbaceae archaeon A-arb3/5]